LTLYLPPPSIAQNASGEQWDTPTCSLPPLKHHPHLLKTFRYLSNITHTSRKPPAPLECHLHLSKPPTTSQTSPTLLKNYPHLSKNSHHFLMSETHTPGRWVQVLTGTGTGQIFLPKGYPCHSLDMVSVPHPIHNGWFSCLPPLCTPLHMFEILSFTNIEYICFIQK